MQNIHNLNPNQKSQNVKPFKTFLTKSTLSIYGVVHLLLFSISSVIVKIKSFFAILVYYFGKKSSKYFFYQNLVL